MNRAKQSQRPEAGTSSRAVRGIDSVCTTRRSKGMCIAKQEAPPDGTLQRSATLFTWLRQTTTGLGRRRVSRRGRSIKRDSLGLAESCMAQAGSRINATSRLEYCFPVESTTSSDLLGPAMQSFAVLRLYLQANEYQDLE